MTKEEYLKILDEVETLCSYHNHKPEYYMGMEAVLDIIQIHVDKD